MAFLLGEALLKTGVDLAGLDQGLKNADSKLGSFAQGMVGVGNTLTKAITVPLLGAAAAGVKFAADLDAEMRNIQSVGRQTEAELAALSGTFVDMSRDINVTVDSAANLAAGFYNIQGSGFAGADAMQVLEAATKAASAGMTQTEVSSGALTAVLNAYSLKAKDAGRISDLLFKTVDIGVGSFEELAGSVANVVPTAAQAGVSFDEIAAGLATMSKQGFSFAEAATSMNNLIIRFLDPGDEMKDLIREMGYESGLALLQQEGLAGAVAKFTEATGGAADKSVELLGNIRAQRAAAALGSDSMRMFSADLEAMGQAAGATTRAFEIQSQSFAMQVASFKNELMAVGIEIGQALLPVLKDLLTGVRPLIDSFLEMDEAGKKKVLTLAAIAAGVGPVIVGVGQLLGVVSSLSTLMSGLGISMTAALGPIGLVAAALAALGVAGYKIYEMNQKVEEGTREVTDAWGQFFQGWKEEGGSAIQIAEDYAATQAKVHEGLKEGGIWADVFIRNQDELVKSTDQLNTALLAASSTKEEYISAARAAGLVTEEERAALIDAAATYDEFGNRIQLAVDAETMLSDAMIASHFAIVEQNEALESGRATFESLNPEIVRSRRYTQEMALEHERTAAAIRAQTEAYGDDVEERAAYTDAIVAQAERMRVLTSEVYGNLAADLAEPLAEMEQELEDHQQAMEDLEAGHAERMAALSPAGLKVEAEKAANAQLAAERRRVLDDLADLETSHQEKVQIYQAQGKDQSIANENAAYEVKKANLETALAGLEGQYGAFYANQLARLQTNNAEATALEEQKYAEEKARLEAAHAEQIAMLQQQLAERLQVRTQELLLTGQISEEQANQMTAALATQFGISVNETDLAVNHILALYQNWAAGGDTTATDIAAAIGVIDTTMQDLEAKEEARVQSLVDATNRRNVVYTGEADQFNAMVASMEGSGERLVAVQSRFTDLKGAIEGLPTERTINVRANLDLPPGLELQSPHTLLEYALRNAVEYAATNPVEVSAEYVGPPPDELVPPIEPVTVGARGPHDLSMGTPGGWFTTPEVSALPYAAPGSGPGIGGFVGPGGTLPGATPEVSILPYAAPGSGPGIGGFVGPGGAPTTGRLAPDVSILPYRGGPGGPPRSNVGQGESGLTDRIGSEKEKTRSEPGQPPAITISNTFYFAAPDMEQPDWLNKLADEIERRQRLAGASLGVRM